MRVPSAQRWWIGYTEGAVFEPSTCMGDRPCLLRFSRLVRAVGVGNGVGIAAPGICWPRGLTTRRSCGACLLTLFDLAGERGAESGHPLVDEPVDQPRDERTRPRRELLNSRREVEFPASVDDRLAALLRDRAGWVTLDVVLTPHREVDLELLSLESKEAPASSIVVVHVPRIDRQHVNAVRVHF